jgi:hypothetical protein
MNEESLKNIKFLKKVESRLDLEDKKKYRAIKYKFFFGFIVTVGTLPMMLRFGQNITMHMTGHRKTFTNVFVCIVPGLIINEMIRDIYVVPFADEISKKYSFILKPDSLEDFDNPSS